MNEEALREVWRMFHREHDCSIDRMVCSEELRTAFLTDVRSIAGDVPDDEILWRLMRLRKAKKLKDASND